MADIKINVYTCAFCKSRKVTRNIDGIVTPFLLKCVNESCQKSMQSSLYDVPQTLEPTHEFYLSDSGVAIREIKGN